jgi:siroheme synthase-like protein
MWAAPVNVQPPASAPDALAIVPVGLRVEKRRIVVVGAGRIAARKASAYADQGALLTVVAPNHGPEMSYVNVDERVYRRFEPSDLDEAWLAVTATGDQAVDGAVFAEAERRRIWCNAADDPDRCSAILPAVSRTGDITIAVSTSGRSPAVASWLRRLIDELLDDDLNSITQACANVRTKVRSMGLSTEVPGWSRVLDHEARQLVSSGQVDELESRLIDAVVGGRR